MRLQVEHFVGRYRLEDALEACMVGPVEEELLPEAIREFDVLIFVLRLFSMRGWVGVMEGVMRGLPVGIGTRTRKTVS